MTRLIRAALITLLAALALSGPAYAGGGNYVFDGGTPAERTQVRSALEASSFNWSLVPAQITIHVKSGIPSQALRGHIWLDADLLKAGRFSWAIVQDEYAHQVDFFLFDDVDRALMTRALGAADWCYGITGLAHSQYGCERFASTLVWAFWPSQDNSYRPTSSRDESAAMAPAKFRTLLAQTLSAA